MCKRDVFTGKYDLYRKEETMDIREVICKLKKEKDAVILAHYYVEPEIQEIADYVGDSFQLSRTASELKNRI